MRGTGIVIWLIGMAGWMLAVMDPGLSWAEGFEKELTAGRIVFHISSSDQSGEKTVVVRATGPGVRSDPVQVAYQGTVTWAEVTDDLDGDGLPELYVYASCPQEPYEPESGQDPAPAVAVAVSPGGHGGRVVALVPVDPARSDQSGGAVVVGPVMPAPGGGGRVGVVPVLPLGSPETRQDPCIQEMKFIFTEGKDGKVLRLTGSR